MPFGPIAHTELQAEIDAQTDKQHKECDRNHIQRADHQETESRRDRQTGGEIDRDRQDDPLVPQRQPKDDNHRDERHRGRQRCALSYCRELVIVHRHQPGQPHPGLEIAVESQITRGL